MNTKQTLHRLIVTDFFYLRILAILRVHVQPFCIVSHRLNLRTT